MPVTAKLSRKFYDKLGDDVANELVEWFNQVDATYRGDLRELNELNFARFRAEVDAGFARADAKLEQRVAEGRYTHAQVEAAWAEGHRVVAELDAGRRWWDPWWALWEPDPAWDRRYAGVSDTVGV